MRYVLTLMMFMLPAAAFAGEHTIARGASTSISLAVGHLQETMIVLPEKAVTVTGTGAPSFQVESGGDFVMVRALQPDARGNLFINFGGGTIVSLNLTSGTGSDNTLVTLRFAAPPKRASPGAVSSLGSDMRVLAGPWNVMKLRAKTDNAGFRVEAAYALVVDENVFVNFSVENKSDNSFTVSHIDVVRNTYGGIKGTAVVETTPVPSKYAIDAKSISRGETANGTIMFSKTYVDFDQMLVFRIRDERSHGPELRISL